ncbi:3-oxoacyl-[acyl-carrier-protein] synthase III C-terminal domain-containing protein [Burkholderia sp. Ac-20353]|uniref:3-oxoacyl-[acyl-carrier-protein] synthase III C-terminal domain-containing protein n=1 Tax=Burkholderia sp. Ac-20353 TaxID=2703894 RepID=UPI00197C8647|nr:3-oxoacyl-[acyl-carrier-protein] synthase III C-terminal domain-containing protein [Burkholderia sp. Ac-20353]MBN3787488.1 3-oxoacyl-ACP synthase [Burkholderia sp. Ac-20353]
MTASVQVPLFSLSNIEFSLPERTVDTRRWAARCDLPDARARALFDNGVAQFHDACGESPVALAIRAVSELLRRTRTTPTTIDALVFTHTIQTSVIAPPASTVQQIQSHTGLHRALAFSIAQQHCVSPMAAIRVLLALAARHPPIERAIIVCSDVIGAECDRLRAIQDLALHSDGACAMLLERDGPRNVIAGLHLYTDGRFFRGTDDDLQPVPDDRYYWSAFSTMRTALRQAGITARDVTSVLPHHVNLPGWARLMTMLAVPQERLFTTNFGRIGHVFGADPFINFHTCPDRDAGGWSLLFSCGLSGCFGAMVIRH